MSICKARLRKKNP